ncbi:hypothetical protein WICPIJ_008174, partial [Wickerhamomyces pijperi]
YINLNIMAKILTAKSKIIPEGFKKIEPTLKKFEEKLKEANAKSLDRTTKRSESLWEIFQITHSKSRYVYDLYYKKKAISKELYDFLLKRRYADANLIAKWKKQGYEQLCCIKCIQGTDNNNGGTCICRVPKETLDKKTEGTKIHFTQCINCGYFIVLLACLIKSLQPAFPNFSVPFALTLMADSHLASCDLKSFGFFGCTESQLAFHKIKNSLYLVSSSFLVPFVGSSSLESLDLSCVLGFGTARHSSICLPINISIGKTLEHIGQVPDSVVIFRCKGGFGLFSIESMLTVCFLFLDSKRIVKSSSILSSKAESSSSRYMTSGLGVVEATGAFSITKLSVT